MKLFYTYKDIMKILNFSKCKAYDIIRKINATQEQKGFRTEKGRVLIKAFEEAYGIERDDKNVEKNKVLSTNSSVIRYDFRG